MKNVLVMICLIVLGNCYCQSKKEYKKGKKNNMEYFNIDKYKDWEIDGCLSVDETSKNYKKNNDRVEINFTEQTIQSEQTNIQNPYGLTKVYFSKNKMLKSILYEFYNIQTAIYTLYDENGKTVNEENLDKPYKFLIKQVIEKVKREYDIDLEDKTQKCFVERFMSEQLNKKPFYETYLRNKEDELKIDYILLDGTTGETLFTTSFILQDDGSIPPFAQYLESLKKAKAEKTAYYKTYKGKDYTKEEWDAFEEEWYQDYQKKKNSKGFWDDIFSRP